jgi:predicted Zn-dependent protease
MLGRMEFSLDLLEPFLGYLDLEMFDEANDELEALPSEYKTRPEVLSARLELLMAMHRWEDGALLAQSLCRLWPDQHEFYIRTAYCLHELKRTVEAKAVLLNGPETLKDEATYHYNLACYESRLGNIKEAKRHLSVSFRMEKRFKAEALEDPDLEPVWSSVEDTSD